MVAILHRAFDVSYHRSRPQVNAVPTYARITRANASINIIALAHTLLSYRCFCEIGFGLFLLMIARGFFCVVRISPLPPLYIAEPPAYKYPSKDFFFIQHT